MKEKKIKKIKFCILSLLIFMLFIIAFTAPYLVPNAPYASDASAIRQAPCEQYPMGTDSLGRCVLSRTMMGARTSIGASLILVILTFTFGTTLGMLCGYYGGILETLLMRLVDVLLSIPQMVLAVAVAGILGGGMLNAMLALGFTSWIVYARLAKSQTASIKQEDFIKAARLGGHGDAWILSRQILPNILGPLLVNATIQMGMVLMGFAGLSFLGLGVQSPMAEWGSMISESRAYIQLAPWAVLVPGAAIVLTAMLFNTLGDTAQDLLEV